MLASIGPQSLDKVFTTKGVLSASPFESLSRPANFSKTAIAYIYIRIYHKICWIALLTDDNVDSNEIHDNEKQLP